MVSVHFVSAALAVLAVTSVDAHSKLIKPAPKYTTNNSNSPTGLIQGNSVLKPPAGKTFSLDPESNAASFNEAFKSSKYKSLKELVLQTQKVSAGATAECGFATLTGATPQPLPDVVEWDEFTGSHTGPCEVWCDNTLAFQNDNCSKNIKGNPAKLNYKKDACTGAKVLTSYWIALHTAEWQVYTGCAPLSGGGGGGGGGASNSTTDGNNGNAGGGNNGNGGGGGGGNNGNGGTPVTPRPATGGATPRPAAGATPRPAAGGATPQPSSGGNNGNGGGNNGNNGNNADCDEDLPEPGDKGSGNAGGDAASNSHNHGRSDDTSNNNDANNNNGQPAFGNGWGAPDGNNPWVNPNGGSPLSGNVRTGW